MLSSLIGKLQTLAFLTALVWCQSGLNLANHTLDHTTRRIELRTLPRSFSTASGNSWDSEEMPGLGVHSQTVLQLDSHIYRTYRDLHDHKITVYIGYWRSQGGDYQAAKHSPAVCLPSNGWRIEEQHSVKFSSGAHLNSILGSSGLARYRFYYWFFSGSREYTQEWQALGQLAISSVRDQRLDGGIVELSTTANTPLEVVEEFVDQLRPELKNLLG